MSSNYKTLLINLDKSVDRLKRSAKLLSEHNIEFERVSAIYGADLSEQVLANAYSYQLPNAYYKKLNIGEVGCYLSHRKAWQKIVDEQLDFAIILEDDFSINPGFAELIASIKSMPVAWDYLKLAANKRQREPIYQFQVAQSNVIAYEKVPAGTFAQAVSFAGAKKLLATSAPFKRPADIDIQYWWEKDLRVFGVTPYVFSLPVNLVDDSEIDKLAKRHTAEKSLSRKFKQQLRFAVNNKRANSSLIKQLKSELIK